MTDIVTDGQQTPTADAQPAAIPEGQTAPVADAAPPADTKPDATNDAAPETAKPAQKAPDSYDFKAPEGSEFDADVISKFAEVAKKHDMSQEAAQEVLDMLAPALAEKQQAQIEAAKAAWIEGAKGDKEFGGDKFDESLAIAKKARDAFGSDELRDLLETSRLGDHPEVIRFFVRVGKAISEDKFVGGKSGPSPTADLADRLYSKPN